MQESYNPSYRGLCDMVGFRNTLAQARRFVLDDAMSSFMSDLAYASLPQRRDPVRDQQLMDGMRVAARLPHKITWIEFNMRERGRRSRTEYGVLDIDPAVMPRRGGWLLRQHPQIETAFQATECVSDTVDRTKPWPHLIPTSQPNFMDWTWRSDDEGPLPWHNPPATPRHLQMYLTGIRDYQSTQVGMTTNWADLSTILKRSFHAEFFNQLLNENGSDLRYLWALLATINDLPTSTTEVTTSKGYFCRGKRRPFLNHSVIHLHVPEKQARKIAMKAIAVTRRIGHQVRGFWRKDWRNPGSTFCDHEWIGEGLTHMVCKLCKRKRIWVREHERGDTSQGFVMHDYDISRGEARKSLPARN